MEREVELLAGDYRLVLTPERGGSIARFDWRGEPLFRPTCGPSIFDTACFPLVPFSNRIAFGRFDTPEGEVQLAPNFPGAEHPHTIHGFGWLAPWSVISTADDYVVLRHAYPGGEWPWPYIAEQSLNLSEAGLRHTLRVQNLGATPMPSGLGMHSYFPRTDRTIYRGKHGGEWRTGANGLPIALDQRDTAIDWWNGAPAESRNIDTVYMGREGVLRVQWPERALEMIVNPSPQLSYTVVYIPAGEDFLCIEPVTHATDALNRDGGAMLWIDPLQWFDVTVHYEAKPLL